MYHKFNIFKNNIKNTYKLIYKVFFCCKKAVLNYYNIIEYELMS